MPFGSVGFNVYGGEVFSTYKIVADEIVESNCQNVDFDLSEDAVGMVLDKDCGGVFMFFNLRNGAASSTTFSLFFEGDYTQDHYATQYLRGSGANATAGRQSNAEFMAINSNDCAIGNFFVVPDVYGHIRWFGTYTTYNQSGIWLDNIGSVFYQSHSTITSARLSASQAGGILAGSHITMAVLKTR